MSSTTRPNIILIMADDMGYSDIGCFGSEIHTPSLDALASDGVIFTQLYNCARCCPTRGSLLTGLHPHQAGIGHMMDDDGLPGYRGFLNDQCVTIAEALRTGGYRTAMSGKWHAGGHYSYYADSWTPNDAGHPTPLSRGFERHFGTLTGAGSFFNPHTLMLEGEFTQPEGEDWYYTDAISDYAVDCINELAPQPDPFFLYVAYTAPHWPLHALPEDIERYRGTYQGPGWDGIRTARHERLKGLGILPETSEISARDETAPPWDEIGAPDWEDARMAVYAAQIDRMDQGIGRIIAALRVQGALDNTLVMFLSDNGGCAEFLDEDGKGFGTAWAWTKEGEPVRIGNSPANMPGPATTFMSYDLPWANASNAPFRLYKHWTHEGGIATPFIAHWPAGIAAPSVCREPAHLVDIMATCLDVAGVRCPEEYEGRRILPPEGESFAPALRGEDWRRAEEICWEHEGNRAVRQGRWKLVSRHPGSWELYDMDVDRSELHDLAEAYPVKVRELAGIYDVWAAHCGVVDWDALQRKRQNRR